MKSVAFAAVNHERCANAAADRTRQLHRPCGIVDVHEERVRHLAILLQVDSARRGDAERELAADRQQQRRHRVVEEIGGDAARIVPVLAPAEVALGIERALRRRAEKRLPVERLLGRLGIDGVVPLAAQVLVPAETAGRPHDLANQPVVDHFLRFPEVIHRRVLASDLQDPAARLDDLGDLACLVDGVGHRLLEVHVLALAQRFHRLRVVPVIGRGDDDDVDVRPGAELAVVVVDRSARRRWSPRARAACACPRCR